MAALNYLDQGSLKNSGPFKDRISVAIAKYVQYILGNAQATVSQSNWARSVMQGSNFDGMANQVVWFVIWDPAVTGMTSPVDQTQISDVTLQTVVEAAINTLIIPKFGF